MIIVTRVPMLTKCFDILKFTLMHCRHLVSYNKHITIKYITYQGHKSIYLRNSCYLLIFSIKANETHVYEHRLHDYLEILSDITPNFGNPFFPQLVLARKTVRRKLFFLSHHNENRLYTTVHNSDTPPFICAGSLVFISNVYQRE